MRKFRPEDNALLLWNLEKSRTAYISGEDLSALKRWSEGEECSGFTDRLTQLGLITEDDKNAVNTAIKLAAKQKAPHNSFSVPESIHIELTGRCPLDCPQCYKAGERTDLPISFLLDVIRQAGEMQVFQIALGGGEPLVYPQLLSVIKEIRHHGMASSITTSGAGTGAELMIALMEAGLSHIQISLNGSSEKIHSHSRNGFEHGQEALKVARKLGMSYGVNWVARMDNIDDFPVFAEFAKSYQAQNLNILRYKPSPNEEYRRYALSAEKARLLEKMIRNIRGIRVKVDSAYSNLRCKLNKQSSFMSGCGAGRRFIALDSHGYYRPCSHVSLKEQSGSLHHVWHCSENLEMFRSLGNRIKDLCAECGYLHSCYGCRAVLLEQEDDFYSGDKQCVFAAVESKGQNS